jgi:diguanylate cyclase (GGDEF)-like protein
LRELEAREDAGGLAPAQGADGDLLTIMMIDIDHFKQVNDQFGHSVGDEVLRRIGAVLAASVRPGDIAARLGGDEFVVVLTNQRRSVAATRAQGILEAIMNHPWDELSPGLAVSASIGVHHGPAEDVASQVAEADRHLYVAKRSGRARVV